MPMAISFRPRAARVPVVRASAVTLSPLARRRGESVRGLGACCILLGRPTPHSAVEGHMGARAEALAKQYESRVNEMTETLEKLTDADWKKTTSDKWTVGVTAHHVAG